MVEERFVKVCGITDVEEAETIANITVGDEASRRPVNFLGFIFYPPSPRNAFDVDPDILSSLSRKITTVGVFVNENTSRILDIAVPRGFSTLQLHGDESPEQCRDLRHRGFKLIKAFRISCQDTENIIATTFPYADVVDYFLFDTAGKMMGGNGRKFDWSLLARACIKKPFILSGGISVDDATNVSQMFISHEYLAGVDINSCFETTPGHKDAKRIRNFINKVFCK